MLDLEIPPGFQIDRTTIDRSKSEPAGTMELTSQLPKFGERDGANCDSGQRGRVESGAE
jgi:hypothetical protein